MRPNDSALFSVHFLQSPLGALIVCGFVISFCMTAADAQTRLDSGQVAPLTGDVKGPFASTVLRDYNSAIDHGNGVSNAIASAISDCGAALTCLIVVPPEYGTGEAVPGFQLSTAVPRSSATTPGNIGIFDRRYGEARMLVNNNGYSLGLENTPSGWVYNYYSKELPNDELFSAYLRQWSLDGGNNQQNSALAYADKTTWATITSVEVSHTPGQHLNLALGAKNTSMGTMNGLSNSVTCYGGFNAQGDLGCHAMDNIVAQGTVEYGGSLGGSPTTGSTSLSITPTQGQYTQGAGRFLVRANAGTFANGIISNLTAGFYAPSSITGAGTSWPVSTVIAQLGTNVSSPGVVTVTPTTFTTGSLSALSISTLVCVADQESFEMVYPTAVTSTAMTATFTKIHPSNATLSAGGVCGYLLDLTADDVTNNTFPNKSQTINGTLHFAWPLLTSPSGTSATFWVTGDGGYQAVTSRWNANSANGYVLYPFAEVISTQQGGGLSDTLTVGPNNVAWTNGDTVYEFIYPSVHYTFGNTVIESYFPNTGTSSGFSLTYNMPLQGNDTMMNLANNGPASFYKVNGGSYSSPTAIRVGGKTSQTLLMDQPGDSATVAVGCTSPCNVTGTIIAAGNRSYYDFISYDQTNKHWNISANSNSAHYSWAGNQFVSPFTYTLMAADSNAVGYIGTHTFRSNTSSNSDLSGELVFSNASSVSQSFAGNYANHPECIARPQFDEGSTNRFWISYSGSSFAVNFAVPVSGAVTYSCAARN